MIAAHPFLSANLEPKPTSLCECGRKRFSWKAAVSLQRSEELCPCWGSQTPDSSTHLERRMIWGEEVGEKGRGGVGVEKWKEVWIKGDKA